MQSEGKRARFFPESGADETISMMLELMSEVWVLRERLYALEKVAADKGIELTDGIEGWQPDAAEAEELAAARQQMIANVTRSLAANNVPGYHLRRSLDEAYASGDDAPVTEAAAVRAA
jgi:hypothetical protein